VGFLTNFHRSWDIHLWVRFINVVLVIYDMFSNLSLKLEKYFKFTYNEFYHLLVSTIFFGFMLSFRDWSAPGSSTISISYGLYVWVLSSCIFFLSYLLYLVLVKVLSINSGYVAEFDLDKPLVNFETVKFKLSKSLIAFALLLTFLSDGTFILLIPGSLIFSVLKKHRLGRIKQGFQYTEVGYVGTIAALVLVMVASLFAPLFDSHIIFQKIVVINLLIAIFSMLPLGLTTGFYLLTTSFLSFFTLLVVVFVSALFTYLEAGFLFTLVIALFAGVFAWILTYRFLEETKG